MKIVCPHCHNEFELKDAEYSGKDEDIVLEALLKPDYLSKLGLKTEDCKGDVEFTATLKSSELTAMQLVYVSANGNDVSITFTFEY